MVSPTSKQFDPVGAYSAMARMRLVEEALTQAWADGLVPGEYHSGIGEEAIVAGVLAHLDGADSMAIDHRCTGPLLLRGTDLTALALEVMGADDGLNQGNAGHMHLMDPDIPASADGIVGSSAPLALGQALAHAHLRPGRVAIAFHGEGAANQGMLLEAYSLAVAWRLPVVFVCKDNRWSITTYAPEVTGGDLADRAKAFGLAVEEVKGHQVDDVHKAAGRLIDRARKGHGPGFLHATCHRPGGHFEGDPLLRLLHDPIGQAKQLGPPMLDAVRSPTGGTKAQRVAAGTVLTVRGARAARDFTLHGRLDPLRHARTLVGDATAARLEDLERTAVSEAIAQARRAVAGRPVFGVPPRAALAAPPTAPAAPAAPAALGGPR